MPLVLHLIFGNVFGWLGLGNGADAVATDSAPFEVGQGMDDRIGCNKFEPGSTNVAWTTAWDRA